MSRDQDHTEQQLQRLRAANDQQQRVSARLENELQQLRRELKALGVRVPEVNPTGRTKLSPEARLAAMRAAAAKARASKPVGKGTGAVRDPSVAARLREEAQQLADEADAIHEHEQEEESP